MLHLSDSANTAQVWKELAIRVLRRVGSHFIVNSVRYLSLPNRNADGIERLEGEVIPESVSVCEASEAWANYFRRRADYKRDLARVQRRTQLPGGAVPYDFAE